MIDKFMFEEPLTQIMTKIEIKDDNMKREYIYIYIYIYIYKLLSSTQSDLEIGKCHVDRTLNTNKA